MNLTWERQEIEVDWFSENTATETTRSHFTTSAGEIIESAGDYQAITNEVDTSTSLIVALEDVGITDNLQAKVLKDIMMNSTKKMATKDDGIITLPDWTNRLAALKLSMQVKWQLNNTGVAKNPLEWKIFVFAPSIQQK